MQNYLAVVEKCTTKSDVKFIKRFINNDEELHLYRASAAAFLAMMKKNLQEATDYIRLGLDFCSQSPPNHADRVIIFSPWGMDDPRKTIGSKIEQFKYSLETNLSILEGKKLSASELQALSDADCANICKVFCLAGTGEEDYEKRCTAGGKYCDCCDKSGEELGLDELATCSRCKLAFYCSSECQKKAWYAGHKQACRKKGQIELGDVMVLQGLSNRTDLNGRFVFVADKGTSQGKWLVRLTNADTPMSVSGKNLVRLRPEA
jgi:hypothetical protein